MQQLAPRPSQQTHPLPYGLMSLWDIMSRSNPEHYIRLGLHLEDALKRYGKGGLEKSDLHEVWDSLNDLANECKKLKLSEAYDLLRERLRGDDYEHLPQTLREFDILLEAVMRQLKSPQFLVLRPGHFGKSPLSAKARAAFPKLAAELRSASNSYACGLDTACVFHCMRALEFALDSMATECGLAWTVEQWGSIIEMIEAAIKREGQSLPKGPEKGERLRGLSLAANEFRWFKDGWRNYVMHKRVPYAQKEATDALEHVSTFVDHLADKLELKERD